MSRVPIPTCLLEKACMPGHYEVSAFLNVTLGTAPALKTKSTKRSKPAAQRILDKLRGSETEKSEMFDNFHFFGNTASSARIDLGPVADDALARTSRRTQEPSTSAHGIGCAGADTINHGTARDDVVAGRPTTLCRIDMAEACELCLHSNQPLQNLNLVVELVVVGMWRHVCFCSWVLVLDAICVCSGINIRTSGHQHLRPALSTSSGSRVWVP